MNVLEMIDELHRHIRSNKYMEIYPIPEPSGPKRQLEEATETLVM